MTTPKVTYHDHGTLGPHFEVELEDGWRMRLPDPEGLLCNQEGRDYVVSWYDALLTHHAGFQQRLAAMRAVRAILVRRAAGLEP